MINKMPTFRYKQTEYGNEIEEYFYRSMRSQYGGEGYIMSFLVMCFSGCFFVATRAEKYTNNEVMQKVVVIGMIFLTFSILQIYVGFYRIKNPYYMCTFFPPHHYTKGPLMRDQGMTIWAWNMIE